MVRFSVSSTGFLVQVLIAASAFSTTTVVVAQQCTLDCPIDAPCTFGNADFSGHNNNNNNQDNIDGMHCDCPPSWTGILCDVIFESCSQEGQGGHSCYHGGECVPGLKDAFGNTQLFCDCSDAVGYDGTKYVGKYCETPFLDACGTTEGEEIFCVNGGTCNPNYPEAAGAPCLCAEGYEGLHCEFKTGTVPDCTMGCENGGHCVVGIASPEEAATLYQLWLPGDDASDLMRCICPTGFGGRNCEAPITQEGESCGSYHCLNDGVCVETTFQIDEGGIETDYHCDCTNAGVAHGTRYGGRFCQYEASQFCTDENDMEETLQGHLYCVNDGTCRPDVTEGCDCPEGFSGFKCDFRNGPSRVPDIIQEEEPTPIECGGIYCFNGGICVEAEFVDDNGNPYMDKMCDCSTAMTAESLFAGDSCQYTSSVLCTEPAPGAQSLAGLEFCVNYGTCSLENVGVCDCPHGWTGDRCQFTTVLHEDPQAQECGDKVCFHGGQCISSTVQLETGETVTYHDCDCSDAFDDEYLYAGRSCQYKSTSLCTRPIEGSGASLAEAIGCFNNGLCNGHGYCDCPESFAGRFCEYEITTAETYVDQDLDQNNDGVVDNFSHDPVSCGDSNTLCHHGGTCKITADVLEDGTELQLEKCDCSTAFTGTVTFAGETCEFKHSTLCTQPGQGETLEDVLFCVNGGSCMANPDDGCDCPTGWTGFHCEYQQDDIVLDQLDEGDDQIQECGDHFCINGGTCVSVSVSTPGGGTALEERCDCTSAITQTDLFAGESCEHKSTTFCTQPLNADDGLEGIMFCVNGGSCKPNVYEGCECSSAWTGFHCELSVDDVGTESNDDDNGEDDDAKLIDDFEVCGDHHCFYGGSCETFSLNGNEEHKCDCSTATTDSDLYAGMFCQYKATSICGEPSPETGLLGTPFCVNGGLCRDDPNDGCDCPTGYTGLMCEFARFDNQGDDEDNIRPNLPQSEDDDDDTQDSYECQLTCQNGGRCSEGAKGLGSLETVVQDVAHLNQTYSEEFFEHCVCPDGWIGVECDHKIEVCGEGEHFCLHGSSCVSNRDQHSCDCSAADEHIDGSGDPALFAGNSCEHVATDICTIGDPHPGRPLYFCVQGGTCLDRVSADEPHPGCACVDGWTGESCEIRVSPSQKPPVNAALIMIVIVIAGIFFTALGLVSFCLRTRSDPSSQCLRLRRRRGHDTERAQLVNIAPKKNMSSDMYDMAVAASAGRESSSRDPFVSRLAFTPDRQDISTGSDDNDDSDDDEPRIFIPPVDEDNNRLHDVNII